MMTRGLLWFDDDARTPLPQKIAEAATRYREREGYAPTVCEVNPQQQAALLLAAEAAAAAPKRKRAVKSPATAPAKGMPSSIGSSVAGKGQFAMDMAALRITPNPTLRPNYILVGVEAGEEPQHVAAFGYTEDDETTTSGGRQVKKPARKPRAPRRASA